MPENEFVTLPKTKRGERTFSRLIESAEQVFYEKGYHGSGIKDITDQAGVGLGTFYLYFKDKKGIYTYLLSQYSHIIRMAIARRIQAAGEIDRKEEERLGLLAFLELVQKKPHFYHIIWESLYIDRSLFIQYYATFGKLYSRQIRKAQKDGHMSDGDADVMAYMLMGIANFVGLRYAMFDQLADLEHVATEAIRILDEGMFNKKEESDS